MSLEHRTEKVASMSLNMVTYTGLLGLVRTPYMEQLVPSTRAKWETGPLGYPKTDELNLEGFPGVSGGRYNQFEHGFIVWTPQKGAIMSNTLAEGAELLRT